MTDDFDDDVFHPRKMLYRHAVDQAALKPVANRQMQEPATVVSGRLDHKAILLGDILDRKDIMDFWLLATLHTCSAPLPSKKLTVKNVDPTSTPITFFDKFVMSFHFFRKDVFF